MSFKGHLLSTTRGEIRGDAVDAEDLAVLATDFALVEDGGWLVLLLIAVRRPVSTGGGAAWPSLANPDAVALPRLASVGVGMPLARPETFELPSMLRGETTADPPAVARGELLGVL
eukprot:CAMPEP_0115884812 /NCGR_PEP_ID=MMETSP0287-20121206/30326_1 /TAXON_ID=412157 /ORGANISM="Chrysochromulina rotalis, Strain UIO044" /LENGTH=115 /DNA_ID=CAMNT_0003341159 /DNA_START=296 /DNA_END=640 /DNA_ORIENTATION=+